MIQVYCPTCKGTLQVPDDVAGKQVRCAGCQGVLNAPAAVPPPTPPLDRPPEPVTVKPADDDRPPRRRARLNSNNVVLTGAWALCFLYVGLAMLSALGGAGVAALPHLVGPACLCYALERIIRASEDR